MSLDWRFFIAPGSALVVMPLTVLLGLLLAWREPAARGAVLRWWGAMAAVSALVAISKMAFYGWGTGIRAWDLTCFSGHTVLGLSFWPVALALLVPPHRRGWRPAAILPSERWFAAIGSMLAGRDAPVDRRKWTTSPPP